MIKVIFANRKRGKLREFSPCLRSVQIPPRPFQGTHFRAGWR